MFGMSAADRPVALWREIEGQVEVRYVIDKKIQHSNDWHIDTK